MDRILAEKNLSKKNFPSIELVFESSKTRRKRLPGLLANNDALLISIGSRYVDDQGGLIILINGFRCVLRGS
ncbi:MAG: hypothetical protein JWR18_1533 [Segetibacter sp.]|nr:hypothetical protein [Segetibacter sp.]